MCKTLVRILWKQEHVLGVTMRRIGTGNQVSLLRASGHSRRGPTALDVDDRDRNFSEVGQANELGHQRNTGAGRGSKCTCAIPARADHHADGRQLVFRLHDSKVVLASRLVNAVLVAILLERLWN